MKNSEGDKFTILAKQVGYLARSAYKLLDINKKFNIMRQGDTVLDIGSAPGSWLQVASGAVGSSGKIVGIDIEPIGEIAKNVTVLTGNINKPEIIEKIIHTLNGKANVVLSDIAPQTTGIVATDQYASLSLSEAAFELAKKVLKKGGNFVCKIFQGPGFDQLLLDVRKHFHKTTCVKPVASRKRSKEVYIIGISFKESIRSG